MNQSLDEIETIFSAAVELPKSQRDEFLRDRCAGRPSLLEEIRSLLESGDRSGDVLEAPAAEQFFSSNEVIGEYSPGDTIGNYRLLEEIGTGGMGVVFMAQQIKPIKRKVAIKIIKLGMDTKNVIARFESERQALAMMNHPSITRVLDAGSTSSGRPFFVMELVRGLSIKKYCRKHRLSVRKRVELFVQVCGAVQHAHQKGIIHRDIKPSNILITSQDGSPTPKVIDFGIAKATDHDLTDKTCFTSFGDMIGTVDYMSPEQAEVSSHDIDTRSDIYSLGVVLYEMLTGSTPYKNLRKLALPEIRRTIKSVEPERPSTRAMAVDDTAKEVVDFGEEMSFSERRNLQGELDWVILKCLEKDRTRRYSSAAELGKDLQRFLDGEPVEAAAPSVLYKFRKFASKHVGTIVTGISFIVLLVFVSVFSSVMAYRSAAEAFKANQANLKTKKDLKKTIKERNIALDKEMELKKVRQQLEDALVQVERRFKMQGALGMYILDFVDSENENTTEFKDGRIPNYIEKFRSISRNSPFDGPTGLGIKIPANSQIKKRIISLSTGSLSNDSLSSGPVSPEVIATFGVEFPSSSSMNETFSGGKIEHVFSQNDISTIDIRVSGGDWTRMEAIELIESIHLAGRQQWKNKQFRQAKDSFLNAFNLLKNFPMNIDDSYSRVAKIKMNFQLDAVTFFIEQERYGDAWKIAKGFDYSMLPENPIVNKHYRSLRKLRYQLQGRLAPHNKILRERVNEVRNSLKNQGATIKTIVDGQHDYRGILTVERSGVYISDEVIADSLLHLGKVQAENGKKNNAINSLAVSHSIIKKSSQLTDPKIRRVGVLAQMECAKVLLEIGNVEDAARTMSLFVYPLVKDTIEPGEYERLQEILSEIRSSMESRTKWKLNKK